MNKIGFKLNKINTLQFAVIDEVYNPSQNDFTIETSLGFGVDSENESIMSTVKVQFEQIKSPFLIIEVSCEFLVLKEFWKEFEKDGKIIIPKGFMEHLAMLTVGTTRGALHSKTENSKYNEFIVPTINVTEMISEDGVFEM